MSPWLMIAGGAWFVAAHIILIYAMITGWI